VAVGDSPSGRGEHAVREDQLVAVADLRREVLLAGSAALPADAQKRGSQHGKGAGSGLRDADADHVRIKCHRTIQGDDRALRHGPGVQCDALACNDGPEERGIRSESGGSSDLEKDVTRGDAIDPDDRGIGRSGQGGPDLKDEERIDQPLAIKRERARQFGRRREEVNSWSQRQPTQILAGEGLGRRPASQIIVGRQCVCFGLDRDAICLVDRSCHAAGRKSGDGSSRSQAHITIDDCCASIRDRGACQHSETGGSAKRHGGGTRGRGKPGARGQGYD